MIQKPHFLDLPKSLLHKLDPVPVINQAQKQILLQTNELISLHKKHMLFTEGEPADSFYIVLKGAIKLVKTIGIDDNLNKTIVDIVFPGEMIGSALMLDEKNNQLYPISAQALMPSEVLQISKAFYHSFWKKYPELLDYSNKQMIKRIQKLQMGQSIQRLPIEKRLAFVLCELIGNHTELKITRSELSDLISTTTESVIRIISKWNKEKIISTENKNLKIINPEKLQEIWQSPAN